MHGVESEAGVGGREVDVGEVGEGGKDGGEGDGDGDGGSGEEAVVD